MLITASVEISGNTRKREKGSGKILGSCLLPHKMSGLDRADYKLGCKDLKFLWDTQEDGGEALSPFHQRRVYFASPFGILGLHVGFHLKRFCYKRTVENHQLGSEFL